MKILLQKKRIVEKSFTIIILLFTSFFVQAQFSVIAGAKPTSEYLDHFYIGLQAHKEIKEGHKLGFSMAYVERPRQERAISTSQFFFLYRKTFKLINVYLGVGASPVSYDDLGFGQMVAKVTTNYQQINIGVESQFKVNNAAINQTFYGITVSANIDFITRLFD